MFVACKAGPAPVKTISRHNKCFILVYLDIGLPVGVSYSLPEGRKKISASLMLISRSERRRKRSDNNERVIF